MPYTYIPAVHKRKFVPSCFVRKACEYRQDVLPVCREEGLKSLVYSVTCRSHWTSLPRRPRGTHIIFVASLHFMQV